MEPDLWAQCILINYVCLSDTINSAYMVFIAATKVTNYISYSQYQVAKVNSSPG